MCHGPDETSLEAGLRLDQREFAISKLESEATAIVPGKPNLSELIIRISSDDESIRMPPSDHGAALTAEEQQILTDWVAQGAPYARHWSYVAPVRHTPPVTEELDWGQNTIDKFIAARLVERGLRPSPAADRYALIRRIHLDLTGLPPTVEEADAFVNNSNPHAYEAVVDDLLQRSTFGEHWARKWLDLARYADSAGYADDPPRTIWAYRDWVIRSINANQSFDQFSREQIAGDLLPSATTDQLIATAFHRNTLTNNEGGTQDEEFRNAAVVDRVNTTMAVWMGTTMACAQCHTHKYDPITQEEYFRFFALFNNTEDADRRNESPTLPLFTSKQKQRRSELAERIAQLTKTMGFSTDLLVRQQRQWEQQLKQPPKWKQMLPKKATRSSQQPIEILNNGHLFVRTKSLEALPHQDNYTIDLAVDKGQQISAFRIAALPDSSLPNKGSGHSGGNFVITNVRAQLRPKIVRNSVARYVRIHLPGKQKILSLAEVQVFSGSENIAQQGQATQSSTEYNGPARLGIDGKTDGNFQKASVTHTAASSDPWWELDLQKMQSIDRLRIWNRTDSGLQKRLAGAIVELLNEERDTVWQRQLDDAPSSSVDLKPSNVRNIVIQRALADYHQDGFEAMEAIAGKTEKNNGWAVGGAVQESHYLTLVPEHTINVDAASVLRITIEHQSDHFRHLLGHFALETTSDAASIQRSGLPKKIAAILDLSAKKRTTQQSQQLANWFRMNVAEALSAEREELKTLSQQLADLQPRTSVPILREKTSQRRITRLQYRGSYLDLGPPVTAGVPEVFQHDTSNPNDRRELADWLVSPNNPLTARVLANRYWETIFGRGIVATSEEFGSQGDLPTHPKLLDWLATEVIRLKWNRKAILKTIVMSATYRQSALVTPEKQQQDADNRWLSRGPRVRLSAEMVRDQALAAAGLLSSKMYGPPVNPPQPNLGLKAAFGGSTDWKTSTGLDRYRRGIYTTWRRSNPYPSMATFDAPNREVCTVRRNSTNTPLQSLVTMNDPVYVEAAQSLARHVLQSDDDIQVQIQNAFRRCLTRPPLPKESRVLLDLFEESLQRFQSQPNDAMNLATDPIGPLPQGLQAQKAAAMTVVCNVLLNLDEMFLKR